MKRSTGGWCSGIEYVAGRAPARPWLPADLDEALDALETCADLLTPPPMELSAFIDDVADWPALWERIPSVMPDFPFSAQAHGLAVGFAECCGGETLVHTDIRDDNILLTADGNAIFCDWNWPTRGAHWIDSVVLLIGPRGDGLDVESVIGERRLLRDVPAEHIDRLLALILGYFLFSATQPVPPSSPYLQRASGGKAKSSRIGSPSAAAGRVEPTTEALPGSIGSTGVDWAEPTEIGRVGACVCSWRCR